MKITKQKLKSLIDATVNEILSESRKKVLRASQLSYLGNLMEKDKYPRSIKKLFQKYEIWNDALGQYVIVLKNSKHNYRAKFDRSEYSNQDLANEFNKRTFQKPSTYFKP